MDAREAIRRYKEWHYAEYRKFPSDKLVTSFCEANDIVCPEVVDDGVPESFWRENEIDG